MDRDKPLLFLKYAPHTTRNFKSFFPCSPSGTPIRSLACISILGRICVILLFQPRTLLFIFRDIDPLDPEDDGPGAIVAAGNWESAEVIVGKAHEPKDLMWL